MRTASDNECDVLVVGLGIIGASVAYHAARAGAAVILVDAGLPGRGVTANSFAWIRTGAAPTALRATATQEYHRLEAELPGLAVTWSGSLSWGTTDRRPEPGPGQEIVDAGTVARLEPAVLHPPEWAVWMAGDGAIDAVRVAEQLVEEARAAHGARILTTTPVTAIRRDASGQVVGVETSAGHLTASTVVLAAGTATAALAAPLGLRIPVAASPATLMRFRAPARLVRTVVNNQDFDLRQVAPGALIAAADSPGRTLAAIRSTFDGAASVELLSSRIALRPMSSDGQPIIGPVSEVPGLYLAVSHSAVTLAATVGLLAARELVDGAVEPLLAGCRLDRFRSASVAVTGPL